MIKAKIIFIFTDGHDSSSDADQEYICILYRESVLLTVMRIFILLSIIRDQFRDNHYKTPRNTCLTIIHTVIKKVILIKENNIV